MTPIPPLNNQNIEDLKMSINHNHTNDEFLAMSSEEIELLKQTLMQEEVIVEDSKLI